MENMTNNGETGNLVTQLLTLIGGIVATKYGLDGSVAPSIAGGLVAVASGAWSVWSHWNMKKVPESSVVVSPQVAAQARPIQRP